MLAYVMQVDNASLKAACSMPYDEARLWKGDHENVLRKQLQAHFQNITKVMDCVGCEKCKLWGKLQLLGEPNLDMSELYVCIPSLDHAYLVW
jgi:hypothetical protein